MVERRSLNGMVREVFADDGSLIFRGWWCPACQMMHNGNDGWDFDGNYESPTFSPSFLVQWQRVADQPMRCHTFVRAGRIEYLSDCSHEFAGKTIPMELPLV